MKTRKGMLLSLAIAAVFSASETKGDHGASEFAQRMHQSGRMFHDPHFVGPEVVYRSSGIASQSNALRAWMNSAGHRQLIQSGSITSIACHGNVCVGRGNGSSNLSTVSRSRSVSRNRILIRR